ncbi:hypothetical protein [Blastopirellula marina]|uniref:Carboxypeptidase regulatory-like domain-containing protein n=1 Tax=Blastopirellula marina TaxID=124 RepID=A0A2S8G986_9BACT|nr:hypothetical protein [Blastopirellula marina]PQO40993.1 hypothetical protein C5Y98_05310 [Blastopirellula marina]PTL45876.1 hypothetical protein C5Y97_05310 [Blastopirellula marina]
MLRRTLIALLFLIPLGFTGCGSGNPHLHGKVTFTDGTPLDKGSVCFLKEGYLARGQIKSDGSYEVGSLEENDGLPPGTYQVYIDGATVEDTRSPTGTSPMLDADMTKPETSGLTVTVPVDNGTLDITVKKPKKK